MIRSEKRLRELSEILDKDNNILICEAIELLRTELAFKGAIGLLTAFYNKTNDLSIKKTIARFMNDLKDQSACEEVITEIRKQWNIDTISMLISSCWQSGLNYSDYVNDLVTVFLKADYITAIECLTVIEESSLGLSRNRKNEIINIIEQNIAAQVNEKKRLSLELMSILSI